MPETLTYADALKILGYGKSRLVTLLDGVATTGLAVWAATVWVAGKDASAPLNLFDLKDEIVNLGHETIRRFSERRSGLTRFDRTQRLAAAHAVLVVASYFEGLEKVDLPVELGVFEMTAGEQVTQVFGGRPPKGYAELVDGLLHDRLPMPEPHLPYIQTREAIGTIYRLMSRRFSNFIQGLAPWDALSRPQQLRLADAILKMPPLALMTYDAAYLRLALDNREFEVWASLTESHSLGAGLADITRLLSEMTARRPGDRPRNNLIRGYRSVLDDPVVATGQAPEWVVLPSLGEAYVNPLCRVAEIEPGDNPAVREWWEQQETVAHAEAFLAGYLTSPRATKAPLVILGEPGSGKSKLTEVLAARLPEADFLPIRVELRDVAAESMIREQIEQAILRYAGERVTLHDLFESADGALPVVLLDGFDELLQAAGINRYDYLEQAGDFQRRQASIGHPVAIVITSRTVLADRVRFPAGIIALQLQPFTDDQVRYWLEIWKRSNATILNARGLWPLPAETALSHRDLAQQPLLLLMLAIFDAGENALQREDAHLGQAGLYEALLMDFMFREVRKSPQNLSLPWEAQKRLAERELERLAVVAFAMFTRSQQITTDAELNQDFPVLFPEDNISGRNGDVVKPAQRATGKFFFIHKSEAHPHGDRTRSYEFLHTTFGEFLVAWLTSRALSDLAAVRELTNHRMTAAGTRIDDGFLYSIMSFSCLAERSPIVDFLDELLGRMSVEERARCRKLLLELFSGSLYAHPSRSYPAYEPIRHPVTRRLAAYSANLTVLLVLIAGEISTAEIFGESVHIARWIECSCLWKAQLSPSEWNALAQGIRARVSRVDGTVTVHLRREDGFVVSLLDSIIVSPPDSQIEATEYDILVSSSAPGMYDLKVPAATDTGILIRKTAFLPNFRTGMLILQAVPFIKAMGPKIRWNSDRERWVLPAYLLARLDCTRDAPAHERAEHYRPCLEVMSVSPEFRRQILLRLREDVRILAPATLIDLLRQASATAPTDTYLDIINALWSRLDDPVTDYDHGGRQLIIALVKTIDQKWPDADLSKLDPKVRVAAFTRDPDKHSTGSDTAL